MAFLWRFQRSLPTSLPDLAPRFMDLFCSRVRSATILFFSISSTGSPACERIYVEKSIVVRSNILLDLIFTLQ